MRLLLATLALSLLTAFGSASVLAFPKGGAAHGVNPEPSTVLPLKEKLAQDLAIHDGIVDAVTGPAKATFSVRVLKLESDSVVVEIHNLSQDVIKLSLYQVMHDGRFSPTSSCPLAPGATSIEAWPELFDAIGFGAAEILPADTSVSCE